MPAVIAHREPTKTRAARGRMDARLKLVIWVVFVLLLWGVVFGGAICGVLVAYYWWMQYECWRAGPDSKECWWFALLKHPSKPREKLSGIAR